MKLTCTLKFGDGQLVIAILKTASPHQQSPIDYQGAIERLNWRPEVGDALDFRVMFRSLAREHQAHMEFREEGEFDPARNFPKKNYRPATVEDLIAGKHFWGKFVESD